MPKAVAIDTYSKDLPEEVQEKILRDNAKETKIILQKQGANQLLSVEDSQSFSTTTSTFRSYIAFEKAFATSGGYVSINFKTTMRVTNSSVYGCVRLNVDGEILDAAQAGQDSIAGNPQIYFPVRLFYGGILKPGKHILKIECAASSATVSFNDNLGFPNANKSTLGVSEILL